MSADAVAIVSNVLDDVLSQIGWNGQGAAGGVDGEGGGREDTGRGGEGKTGPVRRVLSTFYCLFKRMCLIGP